jgi:hypothetical protein
MLHEQKKLGTVTFFQIHRNGQALEGGSYPSLEEASAALEKSAQSGEVTEVSALDKVLRRYTLEECRVAASKRRPKSVPRS